MRIGLVCPRAIRAAPNRVFCAFPMLCEGCLGIRRSLPVQGSVEGRTPANSTPSPGYRPAWSPMRVCRPADGQACRAGRAVVGDRR